MIDISIKGINKSYGELQVLKNINLEISKGQILSIVGKSGAGKTTLLQIIGTLDKPDTGFVIVKDVNISNLKGKKLAEFRNKNIGFVFQFHQLLPEFTALENVMFPLLIAGKSEKKAKKKALEILTYLDLGERVKHKPNELSGGEQQRVAVARALANDPPIILADEPSGNLDSKNAEILHQLFAKLCNDLNKTIIIITHNLTLAEKGHRVIQLEDGEIIDDKKGKLAQ